MTDRAKAFRSHNIRAFLDGRKTMFREPITRVHRAYGVYCNGPITEFGPSDTAGYDWHFRDKEKRWHDLRHEQLLKVLPYRPDDHIWVRETWKPTGLFSFMDATETKACGRFAYQADVAQLPRDASLSWRGPITMPRWASRLTLVVTGVKVERLQSISEADAKAEGIYLFDCEGGGYKFAPCEQEFDTAPEAFADLWESINGAGSWQVNPYVAAYTVEVKQCNIDSLVR